MRRTYKVRNERNTMGTVVASRGNDVLAHGGDDVARPLATR